MRNAAAAKEAAVVQANAAAVAYQSAVTVLAQQAAYAYLAANPAACAAWANIFK